MDINLEAICGDAIIELKKIESNSVDLIVTDPPYNLNKHYGNNYDKFEFDEYLNFSREWIKEAVRVLKPDGTMYVFMGMKYISYIYNVLEKEMEMYFNSWITWYYTQGIGKTKGYSPRHDDILMFTKDKKNTPAASATESLTGILKDNPDFDKAKLEDLRERYGPIDG